MPFASPRDFTDDSNTAGIEPWELPGPRACSGSSRSLCFLFLGCSTNTGPRFGRGVNILEEGLLRSLQRCPRHILLVFDPCVRASELGRKNRDSLVCIPRYIEVTAMEKAKGREVESPGVMGTTQARPASTAGIKGCQPPNPTLHIHSEEGQKLPCSHAPIKGGHEGNVALGGGSHVDGPGSAFDKNGRQARKIPETVSGFLTVSRLSLMRCSLR